VFADSNSDFLAVKSWLRRNWGTMRDNENPELMLLEACGNVTAEKAKGWIKHSGYIM